MTAAWMRQPPLCIHVAVCTAGQIGLKELKCHRHKIERPRRVTVFRPSAHPLLCTVLTENRHLSCRLSAFEVKHDAVYRSLRGVMARASAAPSLQLLKSKGIGKSTKQITKFDNRRPPFLTDHNFLGFTVQGKEPTTTRGFLVSLRSDSFT